MAQRKINDYNSRAVKRDQGIVEASARTVHRTGILPGHQAFSREEAAEALDRLWEEAETEAGVDPNKPSTWSRRHLHIRKGLVDPPFRKIAHAPRLHKAFNDVLDEGRWHPLNGLGWWPITFPGFDQTLYFILFKLGRNALSDIGVFIDDEGTLKICRNCRRQKASSLETNYPQGMLPITGI